MDPETPALLSTRESAARLAVLGMDREAARRALHAGLAGPGLRTSGAILYPEDRVDAVVAHALRPLGDLDPRCDRGMFVGRLGPRTPTPDDDWRAWRGADLTASVAEQLAAASGWWRMSSPTRVLLRARAEREGFVPFAGTVAGIAVVGGEVTDLSSAGGPSPLSTRLELRPAGDWFAEVHGRQLWLGSAGGPWYGWPDGIWESLGRIGR